MRVLAVGAHPDDCELGAGATLASHAEAGDEVMILVLTGGAMARDGATEADVLMLRQQAYEAAGILKAKLSILSFPDQRLDSVDALELSRAVEGIVSMIQPAIVYTHHAGDLNADHRHTCAAVKVACRPLRECSVRALYSFEVQSSTEWSAEGFRPTSFVHVPGDLFARKLRALDCYSGEMREAPHPRSAKALTALAHWRGSTVGFDVAEAFELVRELR